MIINIQDIPDICHQINVILFLVKKYILCKDYYIMEIMYIVFDVTLIVTIIY